MMLIKEGDTGPAVLLVQSRLRELGYDQGAESGFGPDTSEAVRRFQRGQGLRPDGVVGPRTRARLFPPLRFTREYLDRILYGGRQVYDELDAVVATVAVGEAGTFDALQLDGDGAGLSFGILQWAQGPGSLQPLLQAFHSANEPKFIEILGDRDPLAARDLLAKTRGRGKKLPLWQGPWPRRFWLAGRDLEFQQVQRRL
ncbi:MAG TPA: peptidoglycan-binding domain-containing protein, partial [Desulfobaccales bacterium]